MHSTCTVKKLSFLHQVMKNTEVETLGAVALLATTACRPKMMQALLVRSTQLSYSLVS